MPPNRTPSRLYLQNHSQQQQQQATRRALLTQARNLILQARQTSQTPQTAQTQDRNRASDNNNTQGDNLGLQQLQLDIERVIRWEGHGRGLSGGSGGRVRGRVGEEIQNHDDARNEDGDITIRSIIEREVELNLNSNEEERMNDNENSNNNNDDDNDDEYQEYEVNTWMPANRPRLSSRSLSAPLLQEQEGANRLENGDRSRNSTDHDLRYTDLSGMIRISETAVDNSSDTSPISTPSGEENEQRNNTATTTDTPTATSSRETDSILPARIEFPETSLFVRELRRSRALQHVRRRVNTTADGETSTTWDTRYTLLSRTDQDQEQEQGEEFEGSTAEQTIRYHMHQLLRTIRVSNSNSNIPDPRNSIRVIHRMINLAMESGLPVPEAAQLIFQLGQYIHNRLDLRPNLGQETTFVPEAAIWHALHAIWDLEGPGGWMPDRRMHEVAYEIWKPSDYERIARLMEFEDGVLRSEWQPMDYQRLLPSELRELMRRDADRDADADVDGGSADVDGETFQRAMQPLGDWEPDEQTHRQIEEDRARSLLITNFGTPDAPDIVITETGYAVSGELRMADQYRIFNPSQFSVWSSLGIRPERTNSYGRYQVLDLEFLFYARERGRLYNSPISDADAESTPRYTLLLSAEEDDLRTDDGLIQSPITPVQFRRNHRWLHPLLRFMVLRAIEDGLHVMEAQNLLELWFGFMEGRTEFMIYRIGIIILTVAVLEGWGNWRPSEQMYTDIRGVGQITYVEFAIFSASRMAIEAIREFEGPFDEAAHPWAYVEHDRGNEINDVMRITGTARKIAYIALADCLSPSRARSNFENTLAFSSRILRMVWFPDEFQTQSNGLYGDRLSEQMYFLRDDLSEEGRREIRQMLEVVPEDRQPRLSLLLVAIASTVDRSSLLRALPGNRLHTRYEERLPREVGQPDSRRPSAVFLMTAYIEEWRLNRSSRSDFLVVERDIVQQGLDWGLPPVFVEQIVRCWAIVSAWALIVGQAEEQSRWTEIRADRLTSIFTQEVELRNRWDITTPDSWHYWGVRYFVHGEIERQLSNNTSSERHNGEGDEQTDTVAEIERQIANLAIDEDTEAAYTQALASLPSAEIAPFLQLRANSYLSEKEVWHMAHRWTAHRACIDTSERVEAQRDWIRNWMNEVEATENVVEHNNQVRGVGEDNG